MPELSRFQIAVYAAVAVAVLPVGARAIREPQPAAAPSTGSGGGAASLDLSSAGGPDGVVHVADALQDPGAYRLPAGAAATDAARRAGGRAAEASLDSVNLAARLADGQQVVVPQRLPGGATATAGVAGDGPISLGTATLEQLDTIEGVGPVTAEKILQFRDQHGGLSSVEQLDEVSGIGPATMEALRARLQP